jgi:hypothetical protein
MEMTMNTLTKTLIGATLVASSALALAAPASAQPMYRGSDGVYGRSYDGYGRYDNNRYYGSGPIMRDTRHCTSPRFGYLHYDTLLHRRVFIPYRWALRGGYLRDCMYTQSRTSGMWYRF